MTICICGHVKACHAPKCCDRCVKWEEQDLIDLTLERMIAGDSLKPEHINDPVVVERSMLRLLYKTILSLKMKRQALGLAEEVEGVQ